MSDGNAPGMDTATTPESTEVSWRDSLGEDIKENATLAKYDSVEKLAAAHINLQSHMGRDKITKPVTDDDWNDVYSFLGRPESAEAYEIGLNDEWSDGVKSSFDENSMTAFKAEAYNLGLTDKQIQGMVNFYGNNLQGQIEAMENSQHEGIESAENALREEWGRGYDKNVGFAKQAFSEFGGEELARVMEETGLGNNPAILKAFANIAKATMSDKDLIGSTNSGREALTPQEAKDQASQIMSNPAYLDKRHPEHNKLVKQVQTLFEQAYG